MSAKLECDPNFGAICKRLPLLLSQLLECAPQSPSDPLPNKRVVYLFIESNEHLYVGRTNRLAQRYREHHRGKSNDAPFAFKLARYASCNTVTKGGKTRKALEADPEFATAFLAAKERVRAMQFRWVEVQDANTQCLLEIYATIALNARHNDFENH